MNRKTHILHFKLNNSVHILLSEYAKETNKSISSIITMIIEKSLPFIEKNHISFQNKESKYSLIAFPVDKRRSVHAYIPEEYYRKLKQLHQDLNFFSIAQILRKLIKYFFQACEKYGNEELSAKTERIKELWKVKKELFIKENKVFQLQLFNEFRNSFVRITYNTRSIPIRFEFI